MARKRSTRTVYRDSLTGRFVSPSKWKRSKAQGGKRFKRERINITTRKTISRTPAIVSGIPIGATTGGISGPGGSRVVFAPVDVVPDTEDFFESGFEADEEDEY